MKSGAGRKRGSSGRVVHMPTSGVFVTHELHNTLVDFKESDWISMSDADRVPRPALEAQKGLEKARTVLEIAPAEMVDGGSGIEV